jgi:Leucine-rich repeat (LRR) protein
MELLECFQNLQELNLSDNDIRELPNDMAGLKNVAILNLNGNEFNDVSGLFIQIMIYIV